MKRQKHVNVADNSFWTGWVVVLEAVYTKTSMQLRKGWGILVRGVNWKDIFDASERGRSMKLGADVLLFALKPKFEGDNLESHVTTDVSTVLQKMFFQKVYANYI